MESYFYCCFGEKSPFGRGIAAWNISRGRNSDKNLRIFQSLSASVFTFTVRLEEKERKFIKMGFLGRNFGFFGFPVLFNSSAFSIFSYHKREECYFRLSS